DRNVTGVQTCALPIYSGSPITVPVGDGVKGHVFNALGDCLDAPGTGRDGEQWSIHREPPPFGQLEGKTELLETGIKVIDLLTPRSEEHTSELQSRFDL